MRKVTLTFALALAFAGSAAFTADAQTSRGANNIGSAAQNFTPVEPAACRPRHSGTGNRPRAQ